MAQEIYKDEIMTVMYDGLMVEFIRNNPERHMGLMLYSQFQQLVDSWNAIKAKKRKEREHGDTV